MNSKMNSYWCFVLLLLALISQLKFVNNLIVPLTQKARSFHRYDDVLITLFQDCNFELRNIIVFDNSSSSTAANALFNLQAPVGIILKSNLENDVSYFMRPVDPIKIEGLVVIINSEDEWPVIHRNIAVYWELNNQCVIYLVFRIPGACQSSPLIMQLMAELHFAKAFYVCMDREFFEPTIYTHDPYGDTKPFNWLRIQQSEINLCNWTLYRRIYNEGDTCRGVVFNRTNMSKESRIMVSVNHESTDDKEIIYTYAGDAQNLKHVRVVENIINLERILNMNFTYHVHIFMLGQNNNDRTLRLFTMTPTNVILDDVIYAKYIPLGKMSFPMLIGDFVILSKDRGPSTPLEKIANFYGIWTLISLIVVLLLTFIVIWLKTSGRIATACFDVLRLLINLGIVTPIDTLPLRMFFAMIFLYFTVIQSTFSGNLSKFLTIPEHLRNINSLDDLTDPQVGIVNSFFFKLDDEDRSTEVIAKKFVEHTTQSTCFRAIQDKKNDVCIGPYWPFQRTITLLNVTGYHLSNKKLSSIQTYITFRQRFPLIEKFNWALLALSETRIYHRTADVINDVVASKAKRKSESRRQDFRPISFNDLKFAFVLLIIGNSVAFIIFLFEISVSQYYNMAGTIRGLCKIPKLRKKSRRTRIRVIQVRPRVI